MTRDDRLTILAKAAGYTLIPPQEIFAVSAETALEMKKELHFEKNSPFSYSKLKKWVLASPPDLKKPTIRKHLISWIQNLVHV